MADEPLREEEAPEQDDTPDIDACPKCGRAEFKTAQGAALHKKYCKGISGQKPPGRGPGRPRKEPNAQDEQNTDPAPAQRKAERKPRNTGAPRGPRRDASGLLGAGWGLLTNFVPSPAAQRAMAWQAPSAGRALDDALAGSFVDKALLQKVAGGTDRYKALGVVVGLPVMLALIERQPAMAGVLHQPLRAAIQEGLEASLEAAADAKRKQDRLRAKAAEVGMSMEVDDGQGGQVDLIDAILSELLHGPAEPAPASA